jgi:hypothetical protein
VLRTCQHLLLVGGFGGSPYLRSKLADKFSSRGTEVIIVDETSYVPKRIEWQSLNILCLDKEKGRCVRPNPRLPHIADHGLIY